MLWYRWTLINQANKRGWVRGPKLCHFCPWRYLGGWSKKSKIIGNLMLPLGAWSKLNTKELYANLILPFFLGTDEERNREHAFWFPQRLYLSSAPVPSFSHFSNKTSSGLKVCQISTKIYSRPVCLLSWVSLKVIIYTTESDCISAYWEICYCYV